MYKPSPDELFADMEAAFQSRCYSVAKDRAVALLDWFNRCGHPPLHRSVAEAQARAESIMHNCDMRMQPFDVTTMSLSQS